ncbi:MAG TPA: head GIN domain-containing protein [Flavisolibacter sp.]|nr:head GIN domain-containing protein [Flavisolibacter sp.]
MKKIVTLLLAAFFLVTGFAQKTIRDANAEVRNVSGFHAIEVSGGINLYLSTGDEAVAVSATDQEVRDRIKTEVKDGVLKIYYDWKKGMKLNLKGNSLKAYVSFKTLDRLSASGGSDVKMEGTIKSASLKLDVSGGADVSARVDVGNLTINQSGGADVDLTGKVTDLKIEASGGSDFSGYDLIADNCIIRASGGSDVTITVNKEFYAEASGAADVNWKGKATVKGAKASGAGSVSHRS